METFAAPEPSQRLKKRRKVQEACTTCRKRKTRCDGTKPVCMACDERGVGGACVYEPIKQHTPVQDDADPTQLSSETAADEVSLSALSVPSYNKTNELYGTASNVSYSRTGLPQPTSAPSASSQRLTPLMPSTPSHQCSISSYASEPVLPLRKTADDLVHSYFDLIWPMFPVLHRPSFMKRYELLWRSSELTSSESGPAEEALFLAIANLVFALGSQCSQRIAFEQRSTVSNEYYLRAQTPCPVTYLDNPSLSDVQALCLSAIYLQSTNAGRCWYFTGTAIRMAQALGFHVEPRSGSQQFRSQLKLRRCIWHTLVTLDRLTSMGFGRPTMIQLGTRVPLPTAPLDSDKVNSNDFLCEPSDELALFVFSCKLFDILHDVLQQFYPSDRSQPSILENTEKLVSDTLGIVRRLDKLRLSMPAYLVADGGKDINIAEKFSVLYLQQQILYCRLLFVRILALRPLLLQSVRLESVAASGEEGISALAFSLDAAVVRQSYQECVQASCLLIEALHANLDTPYRNSPWHTVYLVFSAATILLAAWQSKSIDTQDQEFQIRRAWDQSFAILSHHASHLATAARALEVLHSMRENLFAGRQIGTSLPTAITNVDPAIAMDADGGAGENIGDFDFQTMSEDWLNQFIDDMSWLDVPEVTAA